MLLQKLVLVYNTFIEWISFYPGLYKLRRQLNSSIDRPEVIEAFPESHPRGFIKKFKKRRITIVEAYLTILSFLESDKCRERLEALKLLTDQVLHSRALNMPLNTARVQLALMKEAIKNRDNKRPQLERLRDFSICSFGQSKYIRKYLKELNIVEVPETGLPLKDLHMGWDSHVHDNSSYGRKTPTQLVIDAFIKGISEISVVYNSLSHIEIIGEAIEAGRILGITVNIGVEFSVGNEGNRFHYIYQFPHFERKDEFKHFFRDHKKGLATFITGLRENQDNRIQSIESLLENFNRVHLPRLNKGIPQGSLYHLEPLQLSDIRAVIPLQHATPMHLGELLFYRFKMVLFNRVMYQKSLVQLSKTQYKADQISGWEFRNIERKFHKIRDQYKVLNPESLRLKYFSDASIAEYKSAFTSLEEIFPTTTHRNLVENRIKIVQPLEHGLEAAIRNLLANCRFIHHAEIYNMHDSVERDHYQMQLFSRFIELLNRGNTSKTAAFLDEHHFPYQQDILEACMETYNSRPLVPACGSDSTGRTNYIPGMGFIYRKDMPKNMSAEYLKRHHSLPRFVSDLIAAWDAKHKPSSRENSGDMIVSMGKSSETPENELGNEINRPPIDIIQAWRYVNPSYKVLFYILIGFIPAYLQVGWQYALIWFGITFVRNAVTDIISGRGLRPSEWHVKNIDFDNLAHSLFWTGFSVPLLGFVKNQFDVLYPLAKSGVFFEFAKFFFICIVNGFYISFHNTLRGFDKTTIRVNFFRSILAWPFAAIFSPIGNVMMVPSIVQAKFWSDFVAGLIEGSGKFNRRLKLRKRDIVSLVPHIHSTEKQTKYIALLDMLYFFKKDPRTRNSLKAILLRQQGVLRKIARTFSAGKKERAHQGFDDYDALLKWFSNSGNVFKLTAFILEHYKPEHSIFLTDLVSEKSHEFYLWLKRNEPHGKK